MKILNLFVIFLMLFIFNGCGGSDFTKNKVKYELWDNSRKTSSHVDKKESTFFKETYVSGESSYITLNDTSKLKVGVTVVVVDPYEKKHSFEIKSKTQNNDRKTTRYYGENITIGIGEKYLSGHFNTQTGETYLFKALGDIYGVVTLMHKSVPVPFSEPLPVNGFPSFFK